MRHQKGADIGQEGASPEEHADLVAALAAAWEKHGQEAIDRMIDENPVKFVQVVASLVGALATEPGRAG